MPPGPGYWDVYRPTIAGLTRVDGVRFAPHQEEARLSRPVQRAVVCCLGPSNRYIKALPKEVTTHLHVTAKRAYSKEEATSRTGKVSRYPRSS